MKALSDIYEDVISNGVWFDLMLSKTTYFDIVYILV